MRVGALEGARGRARLLVEPDQRFVEMRLVERAMLVDECAHETRIDAGCAGERVLPAAGGAPVVDQHLGHRVSLPAAAGGAGPEVTVPRGLDEARALPADVRPQRAAIEAGHVDGAAGEELAHREAARLPYAVVAAGQADPGVDHPDLRMRVEDGHG